MPARISGTAYLRRRVGAFVVPAGKQQQQRQVQHRRQQHEDDQPGQAVDGLLGQGNAVQVKLPFAVSQGRRQVLHLCPVVHPQTSGNGAVAVVQRYGISSDSRWIALAGKRQRARTVQCIKGRCVRCLTGEILHRHLIRAGMYGTACRRKGDYFIPPAGQNPRCCSRFAAPSRPRSQRRSAGSRC